MSLLIDTNVLLRIADSQSFGHPVASAALNNLRSNDIDTFICAQVIVEFWAVATRPESANGLGWPVTKTTEAIREIRSQFPLLAETADGLDRWLDLVSGCQVSGKHVHDARLAALAMANGVTRFLTFNISDFPSNWGVEAIHPKQLANTIAL